MKVQFITFGCSRNQADTELMKGVCEHELVEEGADVTVVNTCFVKRETEKKVLKLLNKINTKLVITGCLAQARPGLIEAFPQASILGVNALMRINQAIEGQVIDLGPGKPDFCHERVMNNPLISIVPISTGCLGSCSYCCTRQARGRLRSRSINNILRQVRKDLSQGVKELWLTSQDTGCYGFDINTSLPELLKEITSVPGKFRVRVGMMNPQHALKILPELRNAFNSPKLYKFLHLPVQSGSDKVLSDMNRGYLINDFLKIVNEFKGFNLSTDVICGYPTETISDWEQTIKLIKKVRPGVLNISRFFARPGTPAQSLKQLPGRTSKERSRKITKVFKKISYEQHYQLIGADQEVLMTSANNGRNEYYQVVNARAPKGSFNRVRITGAGIHHLKGKVL